MDSLATYYAKRAAEYERIYARPERQADLSAMRTRIGKMFAGRKVLELACGTGYWTEIIASQAREVFALDVNEEVLEIARTKKTPPGRVQYTKGSAYEIPSLGRRHNALFAGFWWSHVPLAKIDSFLEKAINAVAPGALIAFVDNRYVEGSSTPVARTDADGNGYQIRKLDDGSSHEVLKNFPGEGELIQRASRCGWGAHVELFDYYWLLSCWGRS